MAGTARAVRCRETLLSPSVWAGNKFVACLDRLLLMSVVCGQDRRGESTGEGSIGGGAEGGEGRGGADADGRGGGGPAAWGAEG